MYNMIENENLVLCKVCFNYYDFICNNPVGFFNLCLNCYINKYIDT
jgi:hypothetical protein